MSKRPISVQLNNHTYLSLQPNPARDYVEFSLKENGQGLLLIKDLGGKTVFEQNVRANDNLRWVVRNNPAGIYFYQLVANGGILQSGKISIHK